MRSLPAILLLAATTQVFAAQPQIDKARQRLNAAVAMGTIGSAIGLIADRDSVLLLHATGELGPATPMTPDAIVRLASITKPSTAVAILMERAGMRTTLPARLAAFLALVPASLASTWIVDDDGGAGVDFTSIVDA